MTRASILAISLFALFGACTQRLVCPAYQSSFIYDQDALKKKFSYFKEDSTPKILTASKNKYLIAVPESYRAKYRRMQTIEMKPVYPVIPDSLKPKDDDLMLAESDPSDTTSIAKEDAQPGDSTYAITKTKEKYNLDQDLYMWYFRDMLVMPDVRAALENKNEKKEEAGTGKEVKKEKGIKGFFKNLNPFKKKVKPDSLAAPVPKTDQKEVNAPPAKKKGGLFKKNKEPDPLKKEEPPKDKKKDDGF
ncbi:MAG TPA: hypothetical protein PLR06_12225 [Cyclobacteriaceae bacterium]|nr:hypothetical protein [Cyclobacteriaceae bacterium]